MSRGKWEKEKKKGVNCRKKVSQRERVIEKEVEREREKVRQQQLRRISRPIYAALVSLSRTLSPSRSLRDCLLTICLRLTYAE